MLIVSGALLALLTWALAVLVIVSLGLLPSVAASRGASTSGTLRHSLWWGLLVAIAFTYLVNLVLPLRSAGTGALLAALVAAMGIPGWWLWRRRCSERQRGAGNHRFPTLLLLGAAAVAVVLAVAAVGPVTNYDSGLYHLQAIRYAAEFATVPGLASVYFPLGYANAEFPLAALLGVGPWGLDGYRLVNGLVVVLALVDLLMRALPRRRGPGFYILLSGITVVVITMVPLSDYWVTSPTQDSSVFVLTIVATAYLADVIARRRWTAPAAALGALAITLVLMRPTMVVFALLCASVVAAVSWRRRRTTPASIAVPPAVALGAAGVVVAVAATARDYVLSGWLQYPLSIHAFDVEWLAPDPANQRIATLGAARDPEDLWTAAESWNWIPAWFARLPGQWETFALGLLLLAAAAALVSTRRRTSLRGRGLVVALVPVIGATAFWWAFTPPSFRFAWGLVFSLGTMPIGWCLWRLQRAGRPEAPNAAVASAACVMVGISVITAVVRIDYGSITHRQEWTAGISVPYAVSPPIAGDVNVAVNESGLEFRVPREGDQCWLAFPTCSPMMLGTLRLRGEGIQSGYLP